MHKKESITVSLGQFLLAAKPANGLQATFLLLLLYQLSCLLGIVLFKKLFEYTLHSVLSSLAPLRNLELAASVSRYVVKF